MPITFVDKKMRCKSCKQEFIFRKDEQEYFFKRGFSAPSHCETCRKERKKERRRQRRHFLKAINAAENVKIEISASQAPDTSKTSDNANVGLTPA
jgi:hypothetical protein